MRLTTSAQSKATSPGEPLVQFEEVAAKLNLTVSQLRSLVQRAKGKSPEPFRRGNGNAYGTGARHYYRMSDWRKFHREVQP